MLSSERVKTRRFLTTPYAVQAHCMLRRAMDRGVSRERLARAFNVNLSAINRRINRLQGICPEATNWLQDKHFPPDVTRILRNMNSARQVEAMELMVSINTITGEQRFRPAQPGGGEGSHDHAAVQRGGQQLHPEPRSKYVGAL